VYSGTVNRKDVLTLARVAFRITDRSVSEGLVPTLASFLRVWKLRDTVLYQDWLKEALHKK